MNLQSMLTDNITELLIKIIEFTQTRQKILTRNINRMHYAGFVPMDVAVEEFSELLNMAIDEHMQNQRLLFCDTENIKFGADGDLEVEAVIDEYASELLEDSRDEYLEEQINKLLENSLNQRVAAELLRERERMLSIFE